MPVLDNFLILDHDTFTPDDKMAGVISSSDGTFNIAGHKSEIGTMRPDIKVYLENVSNSIINSLKKHIETHLSSFFKRF